MPLLITSNIPIYWYINQIFLKFVILELWSNLVNCSLMLKLSSPTHCSYPILDSWSMEHDSQTVDITQVQKFIAFILKNRCHEIACSCGTPPQPPLYRKLTSTTNFPTLYNCFYMKLNWQHGNGWKICKFCLRESQLIPYKSLVTFEFLTQFFNTLINKLKWAVFSFKFK